MTATTDAQGNEAALRALRSIAGAAALLGALTAPISAQDSRPSRDTRKATTTADGDTGLWFVPTGEILPAKKWSFSIYRVNFDYEEGFTDVSNWPVTLGVGLGDRAELFGAFHVVRRIDRDVRPVFTSNPESGGMVNDYPFARQGWSGLRAARDGQDPDGER